MKEKMFDLLNNSDLYVWCRCFMWITFVLIFFYNAQLSMFFHVRICVKNWNCNRSLSFFFVFQLVKKPTHQTNASPVRTYEDDEYETGGDPTVWTNAFVPLRFLVLIFFRSYNGPYTEWSNDDRMVSSSNTDSIRKQHVHWTDHRTSSLGEDLRSIKDRQFTPRKQPYPIGETFNTAVLTESPSSHRRPAVIPAPSSGLSHLIQTAIIPAGSTVTNANASQLLTPSKQPISNPIHFHSAV